MCHLAALELGFGLAKGAVAVVGFGSCQIIAVRSSSIIIFTAVDAACSRLAWDRSNIEAVCNRAGISTADAAYKSGAIDCTTVAAIRDLARTSIVAADAADTLCSGYIRAAGAAGYCAFIVAADTADRILPIEIGIRNSQVENFAAGSYVSKQADTTQ